MQGSNETQNIHHATFTMYFFVPPKKEGTRTDLDFCLENGNNRYLQGGLRIELMQPIELSNRTRYTAPSTNNRLQSQ